MYSKFIKSFETQRHFAEAVKHAACSGPLAVRCGCPLQGSMPWGSWEPVQRLQSNLAVAVAVAAAVAGGCRPARASPRLTVVLTFYGDSDRR